jgi:hypothetical protein
MTEAEKLADDIEHQAKLDRERGGAGLIPLLMTADGVSAILSALRTRSPSEDEIARAIDGVQLFCRTNDSLRKIEVCRYGRAGEPEIVVLSAHPLDSTDTKILADEISKARARSVLALLSHPVAEGETGQQVQDLHKLGFAAGWAACREAVKAELFSLCEDTEQRYAETGTRDVEGKMGAFARGRTIEAKSIRNAMSEVLRSLPCAGESGEVYEAPRDVSVSLKVRGVGRVADEPRALLILLSERPTDDEIRSLHDFLKLWRFESEFPKPARRDGQASCGECYLLPEEVCNICGATLPLPPNEGDGR